ncbi:hypothetical protein [Micromonospora sp. NPDC048839]|uniref:hypothetical protein n=1 Tax=Micromonospora sp. NPDC048839 TaxID=3155641 RepID=UPI003400AA04
MTELRQALGAVERAVNEENRKGGEARQIVVGVARLVDIDLTRDPAEGNVWSLSNMSRVLTGVHGLARRVRELEGRQVVDFAAITAQIDELETQMQELESDQFAGYRQKVQDLSRRQAGLQEALAILFQQSKESSK